MAVSDVIERHIRTTNNWSLLGLQAAYSTVMPSYYMSAWANTLPTFPSYLGRLSNYNKRDRLMQELKAHVSLKISGNKTSLALDYMGPLCGRITRPLADGDVDGASAVLNNYYLRKEDMESILELAVFKGDKNPLEKVDSKTKAALTRNMNKHGEMLPYSYGTDGSKKRGAKGADELELNEEGEIIENDASDEDDKDDIEKDAMIKKVEKKGKRTKKAEEDEDDEPKASKSKAKGKGEKSTRGRKKKQ